MRKRLRQVKALSFHLFLLLSILLRISCFDVSGFCCSLAYCPCRFLFFLLLIRAYIYFLAFFFLFQHLLNHIPEWAMLHFIFMCLFCSFRFGRTTHFSTFQCNPFAIVYTEIFKWLNSKKTVIQFNSFYFIKLFCDCTFEKWLTMIVSSLVSQSVFGFRHSSGKLHIHAHIHAIRGRKNVRKRKIPKW